MGITSLAPFTIDDEFSTVDAVIASGAETLGVDAFCLTWIKFERQLRKLTANLIFQASVFDAGSEVQKEKLRKAILDRSAQSYTYFEGSIGRLTGCGIKAILDQRYNILNREATRAYQYRQKIFHGLQTGEGLTRDQLIELAGKIREYCAILAQQGQLRFGYDGFDRDSLRKNGRDAVTASVDKAIGDLGWEKFV